MNFEDKIIALFDNGRRSAVYVAGYQSARAQAASIAAEADRLIAEMSVGNAELRETLAAKDAELERVRAASAAMEEAQPASTTEPNYSAIGAAIEEAIDDLCPKYTQDNRPHPHDTDNPDYTRLHLVDFKEVARRALAAAQPAPVVQQLDTEDQTKESCHD